MGQGHRYSRYQAEVAPDEGLATIPPPLQALARCLELLSKKPEESADPDAAYGERSPELLVLHRSWSFAFRTALPARAPDFVA